VTALALYAKGAREVTPEDIEAIVGDAAEIAPRDVCLRSERRRPS
jgi:hypothetical protein